MAAPRRGSREVAHAYSLSTAAPAAAAAGPQLWRLVLLLCCASLGWANRVNTTDLAVMMQLKKMYGSKLDLSSWQPQADCSTWKLVDCDYDRVSGIYFQGTGLGGPFPSIVTRLTGLRKWYGDANNFTGVIPIGFSSLTKLEVLRFNGNLLSGTLPPSFGLLPRLYKFYVKQNYRLTGTIPDSWANLNLQEAYFDANQFSGPLPTVWCNWPALQRLRMGGNKWHGRLPACLTRMTNLVNLYFDGLGLKGIIPPGIGALTNLELLVLGGNRLTGPIPKSIGNLLKLQTLFLSSNQLVGPLPTTIGNLKNCQEWTMEFNRIDGTIPTEFGLMTSLERILLDNNRLHGPIPASLGNLKKLTTLLLEGNALWGTVPKEIPLGCSSLVYFNLESNWLAGPPPSTFASRNIIQINIRSNYFGGGMDYRGLDGRRICPTPELNAWTHSSTAFNCLTTNSTCGSRYDELQRRKDVCQNFCGASGPRGACNGNGVCLYRGPGRSRKAVCHCNKGFRRTRNGLSCR